MHCLWCQLKAWMHISLMSNFGPFLLFPGSDLLHSCKLTRNYILNIDLDHCVTLGCTFLEENLPGLRKLSFIETKMAASMYIHVCQNDTEIACMAGVQRGRKGEKMSTRSAWWQGDIPTQSVLAEPRISSKSMKSCEIHKNMWNPTKFARNLTKYLSAQHVWKSSWLLALLTCC